jgi:hypothetical protein
LEAEFQQSSQRHGSCKQAIMTSSTFAFALALIVTSCVRSRSDRPSEAGSSDAAVIPESNRPMTNATDPPLVLRLAIAASSVGAPVEVTLRVENVSSDPLLVNSRLALHAAHAPAPFREISFEIEGPDGKARPFTSRVNRRHANESDLKELAPGASLEERYEISRYYDLGATGTYRLRAVYSTSPISDVSGRPVWSGTARSEPAAFTLR